MKHDEYFNYLCSIVKKRKKYEKLLRMLHSIWFYALIPYDDNREMDGIQLRESFIEERGLQALSLFDLENHQEQKCTVLEMLIALAQRLEFETALSKWEKSTAEWFWILINNLGLDTFTDENFDMEAVQEKVQIFLDRKYKKNGEGGLFPLRYPRRDQRTVELWYQMSDYILENYPI